VFVDIPSEGGADGSHKDAGGVDAIVVDGTLIDTSIDSNNPPDTGMQVDANDSPTGACTGIECNVQKCGGGGETTVSGYVYAPNGTLPLYNVQVFIPNAALAPFTTGVQCGNCAAPLSGAPIATALSDPTGAFVLKGVPTGANVPIVVELGKWRRQTNIPMVKGCVDNPLTDPNLTRLPQNQKEGSLPHIALTTGGCDQMGCMLPKLGIDPMEFGAQADGTKKAVNVYQGSGGGVPAGATPAMSLWGDATVLNTYDLAIFSCECDEAPSSKGGGFGAAPFGIVTDYLNAGGRILTTDFQYTWYKYSPDPNIGEATAGSSTIGLGEIIGGAPGGGSPMTLVTTVPKPTALAAWLKNTFSGVPLPSGATFPLDSYSQMGEVEPDVMFSNIQSLDPTKTVTWASSPTPEGPRVFTVDTPVGVASDKQCGRGIHVDAHVDTTTGQTVGPGYPTTGCTTTLKADEAAFAFLFFELLSCVLDELVAPTPPPTVH
jgi:hypothetical protein